MFVILRYSTTLCDLCRTLKTLKTDGITITQTNLNEYISQGRRKMCIISCRFCANTYRAKVAESNLQSVKNRSFENTL